MPLIFSEPTDWRDLQNKVCLLLSQSGFEAETEVKKQTPRGEVELDVYAIDPRSIDRISYVVECKNWSNPVNQSVVHSFTTVMNETGSNIGYIVSKVGFQSGAVQYTDHTNIKLFTFEELQQHYYKSWMQNYFSPRLEEYIERLNNYIEPCNAARDRGVEELSEDRKVKFWELVNFYGGFDVTVSMMTAGINYMMKVSPDKDYTAIDWDTFVNESEKIGLDIRDLPLIDMLAKMKEFIADVTRKFDVLFDRDIFAQ